MLTDRDITVRAVAEGWDPTQVQVREVMTPEVVYCFEDQKVNEATTVMEEHQIRRLPILSRDKQLVGMVSLGDLAVETGHPKRVSKALKEVSEPAKSRRK
jgi:CBS domain-containing protein